MKLTVISQNGCNPCTMVKNHLDSLDANYDVINVSEDKDAIEKFNIMSTPVTLVLDEGEEVARVSGFKPDDLEVLVDQL